MTTDTLIASIDTHLGQLQAEITRLETARIALVNGAATAASPKPRRARRQPTQPRAQVVPAGKLTAALAGSDGMTTAELAKATRGRPLQVLALLRELESADQIRRSGQRRGTRWHLITDEDRIAARAAEIAAQTKRPRRARKS
jgi:hypothetical protein